MLRYSACMRRHGLPDFPDPTFSGNRASLKLVPSSGIEPGSPAFKSAQTDCAPQLQALSRQAGVGG